MKYFFNYKEKLERDIYILDNHDKERKFNTKCLVCIGGASDIVSRNVGTHNLKDRTLNVRVGYSLNVAISDTFVPNLEWLRTIYRDI